jgi:hypothetical protein
MHSSDPHEHEKLNITDLHAEHIELHTNL